MSFIKTLFAVLLAQVVLVSALVAVLVVVGLSMKITSKPKVADGSFLVIDVYGDVMEYDPPETVMSALLGDDTETLARILENLAKAAADDRIAGVLLKVSSNNTLGYAMIEEIRGAIARVRDAGKPVYAYGDLVDRKTLFLVTACDSIYMPESGELEFVGMSAVHMFVKGTLDKLGVSANIHRIKDYKSAAEMVTREDMSPESKEETNWLLDELWEKQIDTIATDRGLDPGVVEAAAEYMLFQPQEALEAGFIDGVAYWSDLVDRWKGDDKKLHTVSQKQYAKVTRKSVGLDGGEVVAIVHAHGMIGGRKSRVDPTLGVLMGHETVVSQLRAVADDDDVKAVIFRVDSNGGESLTSDIIGHEIERVAAVKPVIVSMVDVAASGGYTISYRGTKIIADPLTITGSIGSISGKFNTVAMWNKIGVTFDWVSKGDNAMFISSQTDFTDTQRERFEENHNNSFNVWVEDVARMRGMTFDDVMAVAEGRVWTGRQAVENGLIDELGGLDRAVELAKEAAGIPAESAVRLEDYPKKKGLVALVTAGDDPAKTAAAWVLYRFVHRDLAETVRLLSSSRLAVWTERVAN